MSTDTSHSVLNGLSDHYAEIFGPEYSRQYRETIAGHRLAHDMSIEEYRRNPVILSFGLAQGPEMGEIQEISIPVTDATIPARVYRPKSTSGQSANLPCYINYHGGGWVIGDIGDDDDFNRNVAQQCQAIVIDVGYRLAPEHRFPVPVTDSWEAYRWIAQHGQELGIDSTKLAVGGFSAGGHISAVICQLARDQDFAHKPCFQLLAVPVCDAAALDTDFQVAKDCPYDSWREHHDAPFLSHARMSWFYGYFAPENATTEQMKDPLLSPLHAKSLANLPPALVVPAEVDVLRDEGIAYARRLGKENDAWTQLWLARRVPHPFLHQIAVSDVAVEFRRLAIQRLQQAFNGELAKKSDFISNV